MASHYDEAAFPVHGTMGEVVQQGMSLRDYFAAAALQGILARPNSHPGDHRKTPEGFAAFAFECADAMLKARG